MRALSLLLALLASPALACAVCGAGDEPSRGTYVWMSVIISLLPLAMLGGILAFVVISSRAAAREAKAAPPAESVKS